MANPLFFYGSATQFLECGQQEVYLVVKKTAQVANSNGIVFDFAGEGRYISTLNQGFSNLILENEAVVKKIDTNSYLKYVSQQNERIVRLMEIELNKCAGNLYPLYLGIQYYLDFIDSSKDNLVEANSSYFYAVCGYARETLSRKLGKIRKEKILFYKDRKIFLDKEKFEISYKKFQEKFNL